MSDECARCDVLGRECPACAATRAMDDHMAWFTERFSSESEWPEGDLAAGAAARNLAAAKVPEDAAAELERLALFPQDIELAGSMRQTAGMLRLWAARHSGASGQN